MQHIQGLGIRERDTLVQEPQRDKDIQVVLLEPQLRVKAIAYPELPSSGSRLSCLVHINSRDIQGLGLHLDNKVMVARLLLNRDMVVELLKGMEDSINSSRCMEDMVEYSNG